MAGYHNRPEVTAEVLVDGWPHTGDIGTLDEDGYRSIVDRMKDMLIYKGYNVYPRELEELLAAQPGVLAAAVVGRPYKRLREVVIVDQIPVSAAGKLLERELRERFRGRGSA
jgi:long-chain acyl-CoA synthetase